MALTQTNEEGLNVSNAGTNGQFLQKQSGNTGGLTWASVSSTPEGEEILSTTNSNEAANKYLRADGDGTCSWQLAVDSTKLGTAGGAMSGNINLLNNNLILGPTGEIEWDSDDGDAYRLKLSATTTLTKDTDYILPEDGSNGQYLKTDGSGNLSWAAVSGGATINNATENEIVTVASTTTQLDAESTLTYDGVTLAMSNATPTITLTDSDTTGPPVAQIDGSGGDLDLRADTGNGKTGSKVRIYIDGSEKARFLTNGGITFNGDTADANGLDDYEEGSWTPAVSGATAHSSQIGKYTKIGNMVYWNCYVLATAGSPTTTISGLPYAVPSGENNNIMSNWTYAWWDWGNTLEAAPVVAFATAATSNIGLKTTDWNGGDGFPNVNFGGGSVNRNLYAAGFYWTS